MTTPLERTQQVFRNTFGQIPALSIQAPGRVNLIGEHTDYNGGFVLPCAINYQTVISGSPRGDATVQVVALDYAGETDQFRLDMPISPSQSMPWANYVRGVIKHLQEEGYAFNGADLVISGNVPQGAGLSSSASLEVATAQFFNQLYGLQIDPIMLALIGQQAENQFVGCNCGVMDQLISAQGKAGHALLMDCSSLDTRPVAMPGDLAVLIVNSNIQRGLVGSAYNLRRQQCEAAARHFSVPALRNVELVSLNAELHRLDPVVARRARHIITDSQRALDLAVALECGDRTAISTLMADSHASMRDDFEITVPLVDYLVEIVSEVIGQQGGVRMTGGGFGGCIVSLLPHDLVAPVKAAIAARYAQASGFNATVYVCQASAGAGICA